MTLRMIILTRNLIYAKCLGLFFRPSKIFENPIALSIFHIILHYTLYVNSTDSSGEGNGNLLQYYCLENPMDKGAWQATVHGVARVKHNLATKPPPSLIPPSYLVKLCISVFLTLSWYPHVLELFSSIPVNTSKSNISSRSPSCATSSKKPHLIFLAGS